MLISSHHGGRSSSIPLAFHKPSRRSNRGAQSADPRLKPTTTTRVSTGDTEIVRCEPLLGESMLLRWGSDTTDKTAAGARLTALRVQRVLEA